MNRTRETSSKATVRVQATDNSDQHKGDSRGHSNTWSALGYILEVALKEGVDRLNMAEEGVVEKSRTTL